MRATRRQLRDIERQIGRGTVEARAVMDRVQVCPVTDTDAAFTVLAAALGCLRSISEQQDRLLDLHLQLRTT